MQGLAEGRIVRYVMADDTARPAIITKVWSPEGTVNLTVFLDGTLDGFSGGALVQKTSVRYDEDGEPSTWHWSPKA